MTIRISTLENHALGGNVGEAEHGQCLRLMFVGGGDMEHLSSADKDAVDGELRRDIFFIQIVLHGGYGPCTVYLVAS